MPITPINLIAPNDAGADTLYDAFTKVNSNDSYVDDRIDTLELDVLDKQDTLVSGTNIKTINGSSVLGSGNIEIEAGSAETGYLTYIKTIANTTMVANNAYIVKTNEGTITLTLPANPAANDLVKVIDGAANAETNNITISRNGSFIMGLAEDLTVNMDNANFVLVYIDSTDGWMIG